MECCSFEGVITMKKYLLVIALISASIHASLVDNATLFGGVNLRGKLEFDESQDIKENGYTIGIEAHKSIIKLKTGNISIGLGTKYDSTLVTKDNSGVRYEWVSFLPVYSSLRYTHKISNDMSLYTQGKIGYSFAFDKDSVDLYNNAINSDGYDAQYTIDGGLFAGLEFGTELGNYTTGLSYEITKSTGKYTGQDAQTVAANGGSSINTKGNYSKIALTVGYKFGK